MAKHLRRDAIQTVMKSIVVITITVIITMRWR